MFPLTLALQAGLCAYVALGSASIGYILLRTGWPTQIRALKAEYKAGWGIVGGTVFALACIIISIALPALMNGGANTFEMLFIAPVSSLAGGMLMLSVKRKIFGTKKMKVSVPKRAVSASIAAKTAFDKLPDNFFAKEEPAIAIAAPIPQELKIPAREIARPAIVTQKAPQKKPFAFTLPQAAPKEAKEKPKPIIQKPQAKPRIENKNWMGKWASKESKPAPAQNTPLDFMRKKLTLMESDSRVPKPQAPAKPFPQWQGIKTDLNVEPRAAKKTQEILGRIESARTEKDRNVMTRDEMREQDQASKKFIMESLREKLGVGSQPQNAQGPLIPTKSLPKSAKLLKEIMQGRGE